MAQVAPELLVGMGRDGGDLARRYRTLAAVLGTATVTGSPEPEVSTPASERRSVLVVGIDRPVATVGTLLAVAFAQEGRQTLLVDADPCHIGNPRFVSPPPAHGRDEAEWLEASTEDVAVATYACDVPNLRFAPMDGLTRPGGPTPSVERLAALVSVVQRQSDRTVIVPPPLTAGAEALSLARTVDGALLVAVPGRTTGPDARRARDALRAVGAHVFGVVLGSDDPARRPSA